MTRRTFLQRVLGVVAISSLAPVWLRASAQSAILPRLASTTVTPGKDRSIQTTVPFSFAGVPPGASIFLKTAISDADLADAGNALTQYLEYSSDGGQTWRHLIDGTWYGDPATVNLGSPFVGYGLWQGDQPNPAFVGALFRGTLILPDPTLQAQAVAQVGRITSARPPEVEASPSVDANGQTVITLVPTGRLLGKHPNDRRTVAKPLTIGCSLEVA